MIDQILLLLLIGLIAGACLQAQSVDAQIHRYTHMHM